MTRMVAVVVVLMLLPAVLLAAAVGALGGGADPSMAVGAGGAVGLAVAAAQAGFAGQGLRLAVAVGLAESGGSPTARNLNPPTPGCPTGSTDRGAWQLNNCYHPDVTDACADDLACAAVETYRISAGGSDWREWTTYTSGAYQAQLAAADQAITALTAPGGDGGVPPGYGTPGPCGLSLAADYTRHLVTALFGITAIAGCAYSGHIENSDHHPEKPASSGLLKARWRVSRGEFAELAWLEPARGARWQVNGVRSASPRAGQQPQGEQQHAQAEQHQEPRTCLGAIWHGAMVADRSDRGHDHLGQRQRRAGQPHDQRNPCEGQPRVLGKLHLRRQAVASKPQPTPGDGEQHEDRSCHGWRAATDSGPDVLDHRFSRHAVVSGCSQVAACVLIRPLLLPLWVCRHPLVWLGDLVDLFDQVEFEAVADGGWVADAKQHGGLERVAAGGLHHSQRGGVPQVHESHRGCTIPDGCAGITTNDQESRGGPRAGRTGWLSRGNAGAGLSNAPTNSRLLQHANGQAHAIDVIVGTNTALGWQVATWAAVNAEALHVKYVIFQGQIIDFRDPTPGWHACRDPSSSCALAHGEHVHLSVTA